VSLSERDLDPEITLASLGVGTSGKLTGISRHVYGLVLVGIGGIESESIERGDQSRCDAI
jgi:hypothetical protein